MMNNVIGGTFEDAIETGQTALKNAAKQAVTDTAKAVKSQITGSQSQAQPNDQGSNEAGKAAAGQQMSDDSAKQFLRDLYGKSDSSNKNSNQKTPPKGSGPVAQALGLPQSDPNAGKTPEELAKLQALRNQLHHDYYQNLVNRPKPKEEPVAEKLEREKQEEEMEEFAKEQKKPASINPAMKQGTAESVVGASG
jgi:hypothetical protein